MKTGDMSQRLAKAIVPVVAAVVERGGLSQKHGDDLAQVLRAIAGEQDAVAAKADKRRTEIISDGEG